MMRLANAWKVKLSKREARYLPHLRSTRSVRFLLASTLNEIAKILLGYRHVPVRKRKSARCASISVLPAPGPAVSAKQRLLAFAARFALGSSVNPSAGCHSSTVIILAVP